MNYDPFVDAPPSVLPESCVVGKKVGSLAEDPTVYGVVPAKIGASFHFRLPIDSNHYKAGERVYLEVKDLSRQPKAVRDSVEWFCGHPRCNEKTWKTFEDLLQAHPEKREMTKRKEVQLVLAVAVNPEVKFVPPKLNDKGETVRAGVEAQPAQVNLYSPEE